MKRVFPAALIASLPLILLGVSLSPAAAAEDGFTSIFDGQSLDGWDGDPRFWRVEDGTIVGETTEDNRTNGNTFLVWRGGEPGDFELKLEYKMRNHNSGIQVRSFENVKEWGRWRIGGYQADIDETGRYTGIVYGERWRGIMAQRGQRVHYKPNPNGDKPVKKVESIGDPAELIKQVDLDGWNEYHIIARGPKIVQKINGTTMTELIDEAKVARKDGLIAFQLHAGPPMKIEFRSVRLKQLDPSAASTQPDQQDDVKRIAFIAGPKSHGFGKHEHNAGCQLLAKCLNASGLPVEAVVYGDEWPSNDELLSGPTGVDAVIIYSDGGARHPMLRHLEQIQKLIDRGVGFGCIHYAVEVPKEKAGQQMLDWTGGYFEVNWSVNPHWTAHIKELPNHPIARGVEPFSIFDEWYYHMRFRPEMKGVVPIVQAVPPEATRQRPDGARSGNPAVRARSGMPEVLMWATERPDGGRGFGFTGGHFHWSMADDNYRTLLLNAAAWSAGVDVPEAGVPSKTPTFDELLENQDYPTPEGFTPGAAQAAIAPR
jgi:type 1 glutamine amidotransferase